MTVTKPIKNEASSSKSFPSRVDSRSPLLFLFGLMLIYSVYVIAAMHRRVWYDELFTLDIARASTPQRVIELIRRWDLNPPISYFLSRWSMDIFGDGKLGLRLPSILEFFTASIFLFTFTRKYIGNAFGVLAILLFWKSPLFYYAVEARPYALLLMFFAILLYSWDRAITPARPRWALACVFFATLGLLLSHVFAPISLMAILIGECIRSWRRKQIDFALWAALLSPSLAMVTYIPLFRIYNPVIFPFHVQASFSRINEYYEMIWNGIAITYAIMFGLALSRGGRDSVTFAPLGLEQIAVGSYLICTPICLNLVLMRGNRAFWPHYCITAAVAIYIVCTFLLAYRTRMGRRGAFVAAAILVRSGLRSSTVSNLRAGVGAQNLSALASIRPDLPVVAVDGITFFEMNPFESTDLLNRLYYLKNRPAAIHYEHTTLFEDFEPPDKLDPEFRIRAHVEDHGSFLDEHRQFLVLGQNGPGNWLVPKLRDDGAEINDLTSQLTVLGI